MKLGPRPAPHLIKFTEDCFETVGEKKYWTVSQSWLQSGPATFYDRAEAEEFARKRKRAVTEHVAPVRRRIKWF
jgi:hypothetical protein